MMVQVQKTPERYIIYDRLKHNEALVASSMNRIFNLFVVLISKKEIMVGAEYQAEVPFTICHYTEDEKG